MKIRAYLNLKDRNVTKHKIGYYYCPISVDGAEVEQMLSVETGRFYVEVDSIDPHLPKELEATVVAATSRDYIDRRSEQWEILRPGTYVAPKGNSHAEIREALVHGSLGFDVDVRADTIEALCWFRRLVLSGNAKRELSYAVDAA